VKCGLLVLLLSGVFAMGAAFAEREVTVEKHVVVYHEPGRFAGWPANHGIWSWGNEILVGFTVGYHKDRGPRRHAIDPDKPRRDMLARSLDGGETWMVEDPAEKGFFDFEAEAVDCPGGIDFTHPGFAMKLRLMNIHVGPSRFYYSYDRGKTWKGPFKLPQFGTPGIAARTDYIVNGKHDCMLFLTAGKSNGQEGRPICVRTTDGGKTWKFVAWIGPEPEGFAIMPASERLSGKDIVVVLRRRRGLKRWLTAYISHDDGYNWEPLDDPVSDLGEGNPPSLIKLADGRLCLTYGVREKPFRICAKFGRDGGRTWSEEIVLRDDGAGRDMGYVRSVQRPDGKVVTVYYFTDSKIGVERHIAATIWDPGK